MAMKQPGADHRAETARRLQKAEAMGADAQHVAGEIVSMAWSRPNTEPTASMTVMPENDRPGDDISKSLLSFSQEMALRLLPLWP